ncbi:primosomal replication protein [Bisgaard Taxon 10/6]|uniref:primosomal replication protein n=1 Tax=Exercitatus varius TaxID=67857 RepID=UPI00294B98A6|nr:primosomal replication protein [Exercitatus varius]MDG2959585.1 primosomal replication protein [Exercitatus varius]
MQNLTALLSRLQQLITQLQQQYEPVKRQILYAKFDPAVFSENFQPVEFYLNEIRHCVEQISRLTSEDVEQTAFLSEKLSAQYNALTDALSFIEKPQGKSAVNFKQVFNEREKRRRQLEQLPPRERLVKYYEALQALNEKLNEQKDLQKQSQSETEKMRIQQQIDITRRRRQRCLDAIEVLEEYLAFKQNQSKE